jgi:hypothetical protein
VSRGAACAADADRSTTLVSGSLSRHSRDGAGKMQCRFGCGAFGGELRHGGAGRRYPRLEQALLDWAKGKPFTEGDDLSK